jgi:hypothetical protein
MYIQKVRPTIPLVYREKLATSIIQIINTLKREIYCSDLFHSCRTFIKHHEGSISKKWDVSVCSVSSYMCSVEHV